MLVEYTISADEYIEAGILNGEMSVKTKRIHYAIDLLLIVAGIYFFIIGMNVWAAGCICGAIGGNLLPYLIKKYYVPWYLSNHYKKYPLVQKSVGISFNENIIQFNNESGESRLSHNELIKWKDNKELLLIYVAPRLYYPIPKRISESGFPLSELLEFLENNVKKAT